MDKKTTLTEEERLNRIMNKKEVVIRKDAYELKKFLRAIYWRKDPEEFIRVVKINSEGISKVKFFSDVDKLLDYVLFKDMYYNNTYFQLSTVDETGGKQENLLCRYCLAFDFDKKDNPNLTAKEIYFRVKKIGFGYDYILDTGNGFHMYTAIEKTDDLDKVDKVQKVLAKLLGADLEAIKKTQILRVPFTYNIKNLQYKKKVRFVKKKDVKLKTKYDLKRQSINYWYNKYCTIKNLNSISDDNIATDFVLNNTNTLKPCVIEILKNGSVHGCRNSDLKKIIVALRMLNKSLNDIRYICREWNKKNDESLKDLEYQIDQMYYNLKTAEYNCANCSFKANCFKKVESDFNYNREKDDKMIISIENKIARQISKKRGYIMNEYELLVVSVLKNYGCLTREEIMDKLTYKKKKKIKNVAMCERVLKTSLKSLVDNGILEEIKGVKKLGVPNKYQVKKIKCKTEDEFDISYFVTLAVVWGIITPSEMRLYYHLRYKHNLAVKNGEASGNIFSINQSTLADELKVGQPRISEMVEGLIDSKILDIWEKKINEKGFEYYIYRLNK